MYNGNLLELESLRSELIEKTLNTSSNFLRLSLYQNYFEKILSLNNTNFSEAFLKEFVDDFISCITKYEVWGTEPERTEKLLELLNILAANKLVTGNLSRITTETDRIKNQYEQLNLILEGKEFEEGKTRKAFFPLIDREAPINFYGIVESVTVRINKAVDSDRFIIIPSEKEIENQILEQCKRSWLLALDLSKKYISKPYRHHEVIISFDKMIGFYEGNSLGIALTLSFLEQILKFYNPTYIIDIKEQSAFTGGVNDKGMILTTGEEIIKQKVRTVFFSEVNNFVLPKTEETYAYFALTQLKQKYPDRNLKLIPTEDINDVINRRDLIDIKKQKLAVRGGKFVKKNWLSAVITVVLALFFAYLFVVDWDDNPVTFSVDGKFIYIKNKNEKVLWRKPFFASKEQITDIRLLNDKIMIVDIDNDKINEVLLTNDASSLLAPKRAAGLICFNKSNKEIWEYRFTDKVNSKREFLGSKYNLALIDTATVFNEKSLFLITINNQSFSSAVLRIDLKSGKRLNGTIWSSGFVIDALIKEENIIGVGYDNGYEEIVLFNAPIDKNTTVRRTTDSYLIQYYPIIKMNKYIRFPKTDFDNYYKHRTPGPISELSFSPYERAFRFNIGVGIDTTFASYNIQLDEALNILQILISNDYRVRRDSLVAQNKLPPPFTDTKEYKSIILDNILYYKDRKWVNRNGVEKK